MGTSAAGAGGAGQIYREGIVYADRWFIGGSVQTHVAASFTTWTWFTPTDPPPRSCTELVRGSCRAVTCEPRESQVDYTVTYPLAGPITITGPGFSVVVPEPAAEDLEWDDGWYGWTSIPPTRAAGTTIGFRSDGNEVPAFALSIDVPAAPALIEPVTLVGLVIPRSEPFLTRWDAASGPGEVFVYLGHQILCRVPVAAGEVLIEPELLATLTPSNESDLQIFAGTLSTTTIGDWSLHAHSFSNLSMTDPMELSMSAVAVE